MTNYVKVEKYLLKDGCKRCGMSCGLIGFEELCCFYQKRVKALLF